jgi:hypothetical protein
MASINNSSANKCCESMTQDNNTAIERAICPACIAEESRASACLIAGKPIQARILGCWGGDCVNRKTSKNTIPDSEDEDEEGYEYDDE